MSHTWDLAEPWFENWRQVCEIVMFVFFAFASYSVWIVMYLRVQLRSVGKYTGVRASGYLLQPPLPIEKDYGIVRPHGAV